jgi:glycosyltransferase involved in cell wall biosynthesis
MSPSLLAPDAATQLPDPQRQSARPLRVMFIHTLMPVGGAETLLVNLIRRLDRERFSPEVCCLKFPGPLGEVLKREVPFHSHLLANKYDVRVLPRLAALLRRRQIDAVVTVGAGDRMFWGRLAARLAGVPVVLTALHSTGWPDCVGRLNRMLTPITDGFIAVAEEHGRYLREVEKFPAYKVFVIPNGVDIERFQPRPADPRLRQELGLPLGAPVVGIVAALRPEKNHELFLRVAARVSDRAPKCHFLIVGDGELRAPLEELTQQLGLQQRVHFLGTRSDIPEVIALMDIVVLTSKMEASPVTILEAMACGKPFVAPRVGSIPETIVDGTTGVLVEPGDEEGLARGVLRLLDDPRLARQWGQAARQRVVERYSLETMVQRYEQLLMRLFYRSSSC